MPDFLDEFIFYMGVTETESGRGNTLQKQKKSNIKSMRNLLIFLLICVHVFDIN